MALNLGCRITFAGHATFILDTDAGARIVIDPFLTTNPTCPAEWKEIDRCDAVLLTHGHFDHVSDAAELAKRCRAPIVAIIELAAHMATCGVEETIGMNKGGTTSIAGVDVTMVNAVHSGSTEVNGVMQYMGDAAGLIVTLPGGHSIYDAGDTAVFGDMALIRDLYRPTVAMLPIGDFFTMGPREAALAASLIQAPHVIPMHYGTFPVLSGTVEEFRDRLRYQPEIQIHGLQPGEWLE